MPTSTVYWSWLNDGEEVSTLGDAQAASASGSKTARVRLLSMARSVTLSWRETVAGSAENGILRPQIEGTDEAIWRRVHLIPFDVTIPPENCDHDLLNKLNTEEPGSG